MLDYKNNVFYYKKHIYHLLTNQNLIKLSYNQILDYPENFIFDINLRYCLSKDKKKFLQNQLIKLIQKDITIFFSYQFLETKTKKSSSAYLKWSLKNIVIKQVIANILANILQNSTLDFPPNFKVAKERKKAGKDLKMLLKKTNSCIHFYNFNSINKVNLNFFLQSLGHFIKDQKFIRFFEQIILENKFDNLFNKYSKFDEIISNLYLLHLDYFIFYFCNNNLKLFKNKLYFKNKKKTEFLISKALFFIKQKDLFVFKKQINLNNKTIQKISSFYYLRYLDNIFFCISNTFLYSHSFQLINKIKDFCKSFLHLTLKTKNWLDLKESFVSFCAINKKKKFKKQLKKNLFL